MDTYTITEQFKTFVSECGICLAGEIVPDGKIHRTYVVGDRKGTRNAAYQLHIDGRPNGWAESHKTGHRVSWKLQGEFKSNARVEDFTKKKAERDAETLRLQAEAAKECRQIRLTKTGLPIGHAYLKAKKVRFHHARLTIYKKHFEALTVPMVDETGTIVNLQYIYYENQVCKKRYHFNARKQGCFSAFGTYHTSRILIGEGWATCASLYEATGLFTIAAMDAGNLEPVAEFMRSKFPEAQIIVCGDNDENQVGQKAAEAAAKACNGRVIIPPIVGFDFNDYVSDGGVIDMKDFENEKN